MKIVTLALQTETHAANERGGSEKWRKLEKEGEKNIETWSDTDSAATHSVSQISELLIYAKRDRKWFFSKWKYFEIGIYII